MAITLGAFTKSADGSFTGTLKTLNVTASLVIVPVDKPLPAETRAYVAGIEKALAGMPETVVTNAKTGPSSAQDAPQIAFDARLFFPISTGENSENAVRNGELFVPLSTQKPKEK